MTKAQKQAAERAMLKQMLESNPQLKRQVDALINMDEKDRDTVEIVKQYLIPKFNEIRNQGVMIGWYSFAIRSIANIESMNTIDEVKNYLLNEATKAKERLGLGNAPVTIDEIKDMMKIDETGE